MTDERPERSLLSRPAVQFSLAGLWFVFGVVEYFVADGAGRWFTLGCGVFLTMIYTLGGMSALRKARAAEANS